MKSKWLVAVCAIFLIVLVGVYYLLDPEEIYTGAPCGGLDVTLEVDPNTSVFPKVELAVGIASVVALSSEV